MAEERSILDVLLDRGVTVLDRVIDRQFPNDELELDLLNSLISRAEAAESFQRRDSFSRSITGGGSSLTTGDLLLFGGIALGLFFVVPKVLR